MEKSSKSLKIMAAINPSSPHWPGTDTHSIMEAVHQKRQSKQPNKDAPFDDESSDRPIDIVVIVVDVSSDAALQTAQLVVTDPSLSSSTYCARIWLKGQSALSVQTKCVGTADVLRFNRIVISNDYERELQSNQTSTSRNSFCNQIKIVCEFQQSWKYPEAGLSWTRLCSIIDGSPVYQEDNIPQNLETSRSRIKYLVDWYATQSHNKLSLRLRQRQRALSEILSAGILSNVVVKVLNFDRCKGSFNPSSTKRSRSGSGLKTIYTATLTDDSDSVDVMSLHNCQRWEEDLKIARVRQTWIKLTHLVSGSSGGEIFLLPTPKSMLVSVVEHNRVNFPQHSITNLLSASHSIIPPNLQDSISIISPIREVYVPDVDMPFCKDKMWLDSDKLFSVLIQVSEKREDTKNLEGRIYSYRPITLTLKGGNGLFSATANSMVVRVLCGSIEAMTVIKHKSIRSHVFQLIKGLLTEEVHLEWRLSNSFGSIKVDEVVMKTL